MGNADNPYEAPESPVTGPPVRRRGPLRGRRVFLVSGTVGVLCGVSGGRALAVYGLSRDPELWADYRAGRHISEDQSFIVGLPMFFGLLGAPLGLAAGLLITWFDRKYCN
ncbi:MAG: hypothetical protein U0835_23940 [Isosphaeraceae bacterium]